MGRRRKSSTSTVATVDQVRSSWAKEQAVLKPCPPDIADDLWPIFILTDAVIYEKDGKTMGNPLFVDKVGPMVIRGRLEVDEEEEDAINALVNPRVKSAFIEITGSANYSIGYNPPTLWVAGAAGWFEIRPAPQYEAVYLDIRQAVVLFFEVQDVYLPYQAALNKVGKKKSSRMPTPPTLGEVFFRYAVGAGDGVTRDEAEARYVKWTQFFLSHFPKDYEVEWEGTPFAKWIKEQDAKKPKVRAKTATPQPLPPPSSGAPGNNDGPSRTVKRHSIQDVEMTDLASPSHDLVIRKGKEKVSETPIPLPPHIKLALQSGNPQPKPSHPAHAQSKTPQPASPQSESPSDSESPLDRLLDILEEIASTRDILRKGIKAKTVQTQLYLKCSVSKYGASPEILAFYAKDLLPRLGREWKGTEFYGWLKEVSSKPLKFEHITADKIPLSTRRRAKAAPRTSKGADVIPGTGSDDGSQPPDRARKSGKGAALRPSQKRPAGEMDLDDESTGGRGRSGKYVKYFQPIDIGEDDEDDEMEESSNADSILEEVDEEKYGSSVPLPKNAVPIVVHAEKIPSMSPAGPHGTWQCEQEGCGYVVRAADDQAGQERIMQHFLEHEHQKEKVDLALKESRGHMPINHLLEKIQALGQKTLERATGTTVEGEKPVPAPIKRRLLA